MNTAFLPISKQDMVERDWHYYDFLLITGDAYVDHPSFGTAIIGRVLEAHGYRVAILSQPDWKSIDDFIALGKPRYGVLINSGNIDSMVAHYTVAKKRRNEDAYSPGGKAGKRPDRAVIVYANRIREAYGEIPIIIGGLEASLRRFAHYDYWDNKVRRSILLDAQADILIYGMGEKAVIEIAKKLAAKTPVQEIRDVKGTCFLTKGETDCEYPFVRCASFEEVRNNKRSYAKANLIQYEEHDAVSGKAILQAHGSNVLVVNPPAPPLTTEEFDEIAELPYVRAVHPVYKSEGGVPAIEEVQFSIAHNRGCFGACNFCSLAFHQGRTISARSHESVLTEAIAFTEHSEFKGYIHDVGGPTANFRRPSCKKQLKAGFCKNKQCLAPTACSQLDADHSDYLHLLRKLRNIPKVKKVFIRSGIRFDFLLRDKNGECFAEIVRHHISGQLKVAPEHCVSHVLDYMGKPHIEVYEQFQQRYKKLNSRYQKEQYLVPYLMSSHPGSELKDAVAMAQWLNKTGRQPEQVQDFYPTPGTLSTCMYYTGLHPKTLEPVYVPKDREEKAMQRALLQWKRPEKRALVEKALRKAGRTDLIGYGSDCLIRPLRSKQSGTKTNTQSNQNTHSKQGTKSKGKNKSYGKTTGKSKQRKAR